MIVWFGVVEFGYLFVMGFVVGGGCLLWVWCGDCLLVWLAGVSVIVDLLDVALLWVCFWMVGLDVCAFVVRCFISVCLSSVCFSLGLLRILVFVV